MSTTSLLAGVAGEYFVAAELSRRGLIASISLGNTRGIDILATNAEASRSITIQCKTSQVARKVWVLNEKSEDFVSATHLYVFVALGGVSERPTYHIASSHDVVISRLTMYPEQMIHNGTFSLIDTGERKFLVTCHHVWKAYLDFRHKDPDAKLGINLAMATQASR